MKLLSRQYSCLLRYDYTLFVINYVGMKKRHRDINCDIKQTSQPLNSCQRVFDFRRLSEFLVRNCGVFSQVRIFLFGVLII